MAAVAGATLANRDGEQERLPDRVEGAHRDLVEQLSADQVALLSRAYPGFRLVRACSGHFSGVDTTETVLGLWKPLDAAQPTKPAVRRVGLIWSGTAWDLHAIDDELETDQTVSRSFPMRWYYTLEEGGFAGGMKCGAESEIARDPDLSRVLGDKPLFDLESKGLQNNTIVCFATDGVYNNWDCLVFSPADGRFRLWFQKAHAN